MRSPRQERSGNVVVFTAMMMVLMFGMLAFALDIGYIHVVQTEMNRSADAAALASAWKLLEEESAGNASPATAVRSTAAQYAEANKVAGQTTGLAVDDVSIGQLTSSAAAMSFDYPGRFNAVQVRVRKTASQNGEIPLFFAGVFGVRTAATEAAATAMFVNNFSGFKAPSPTENLGALPFALKKQTWDSIDEGAADDQWKWNEELGRVESGHDGILEVNLYPQETDSSGNCGTVDIGSPNNSTNDIKRQIVEGISPEDLGYLPEGKLQLDENGELILEADTGISAGVKSQLESIIGKPRIIPIYSTVTGNGNNGRYTIVGFAGVRVLEVVLTGSKSSKHVTIQPARVISRGAIPNPGVTQTSSSIYSPVWLVR